MNFQPKETITDQSMLILLFVKNKDGGEGEGGSLLERGGLNRGFTVIYL